jgi:hypothetical protein
MNGSKRTGQEQDLDLDLDLDLEPLEAPVSVRQGSVLAHHDVDSKRSRIGIL